VSLSVLSIGDDDNDVDTHVSRMCVCVAIPLARGGASADSGRIACWGKRVCRVKMHNRYSRTLPPGVRVKGKIVRFENEPMVVVI
jgi:hypothetical protein